MGPSTFSIVAADGRDIGAATESRFPAVGAVVPWARANVGAICTQSYANTTFGPRGLELLGAGRPPDEVLRELLATDPEAEKRQVGIVDARGRAAAFTGRECLPWAGHRVGQGYACQGNILTGEAVVASMGEAFEATKGDLVDRLLAALEAGQRAGGDRRGQQSAALLVVREKGGYGGFNDRYVDLRVDDHPRPIEELRRIFQVYDLILLDRGDPGEYIPIDAALARELQELLAKRGFYRGPITGHYDGATRRALEDWCGWENLEGRFRPEALVSRRVLEYLRDQVHGRRP